VGGQGPPGTGKTRTLLAMMKVLADANRAPHRWKKFGTMLACAGTNAATDNLAEGLLAEGVRVVRLGQPAKVTFLYYRALLLVIYLPYFLSVTLID